MSRHWVSFLLAACLGVTAGYFFHVLTPGNYSSETAMIVTASQSRISTMRDAVDADSLAQGGAKTALYLGKSALVAQEVALQMGESTNATELRGRIKLEVEEGSRLLDVSAQGATPEEARQLAAAWVSATQKSFVAAGNSTLLRLDRIGPLQLPESPERRPLTLELAVGLLLGLVLWVPFILLLGRRAGKKAV